ncbi:MAG: hypothetical protein AAB731_02100 [Patescibacteria group bacterium]
MPDGFPHGNTLFVRPMVRLSWQLRRAISNIVKREFGFSTVFLSMLKPPKHYFLSDKGAYDGDRLLTLIDRIFEPEKGYLALGIIFEKLYSPLNKRGAGGLAFIGSRSMIITLFNFPNAASGKLTARDLVLLHNLLCHETYHIYGNKHCDGPDCIMKLRPYISLRRQELCAKCAAKFAKNRAKRNSP